MFISTVKDGTIEMRPIKNRRGEIKGYIQMIWNAANQMWMTIPDREN